MGKERFHGHGNILEKTVWKGSRNDLLIAFLIFTVSAAGLHVFICFNYSVKDNTSFMEEIKSPLSIITTFFIVIVSYGFPLFLVRKHLPKSFEINHKNKSLYIQRWRKKQKTLRLELSHTTYSFYAQSWYCVLEINGIFYNSRGFPIQKSVYKIIAPRLGMIWDQLRLLEITRELEKENVQKVKPRKASFSELINE